MNTRRARYPEVEQAVERAVAAERERCATVVESYYLPTIAELIRTNAPPLTPRAESPIRAEARARVLSSDRYCDVELEVEITDLRGDKRGWHVTSDHPIVRATQLRLDTIGNYFVTSSGRYRYTGLSFSSHPSRYRVFVQEVEPVGA